MRLVIDIPEEFYKFLKTDAENGNRLDAADKFILNGIPLEDILQIIDNAKWMNKVLQGQSNIEADKE